MVCGTSGTATLTVNPLIQFAISITNEYVNQANVPLWLDIQAGTPYYYDVMVDSTSFSSASWTAYTSSNITVNLGTTQGWHTVWVGLRDMPGGVPTWNSVRFELILTPPTITITSPSSTTVDQPVLQLQGYANVDLYSISYDLTNAAGLVTNQDVLVLNRGFDTNQWRLRTNTFQAFDIGLTPGNNTITLHAMDWAGNQTSATYVYVLDYSGKTSPVIELNWPTDGAVISGGSFTCRGSVDDPTATVSAQIVDSSGNTNVVSGIVERNGNFWVENVPMAAGTSSLTLTATDAVGNTSTSTIAVVQSSVHLSIASIPDITCQKTINVSGTIDNGGYSVWVNGVLASQSGTSWTANNVPVNGAGTAVIQALAISTSDHNGNGTPGTGGGGNNSTLQNPGNPTPSAAWAAPYCEAAPDKLPVIIYTQYHQRSSTTNDAYVLAQGGLASRNTYSEDWSLGVGGQTLDTGWSCENDGAEGGTPPTGTGFGWESTTWDAATGTGTITGGASSILGDYTRITSSESGSECYNSSFTGSASSGCAADYDGTGTAPDWESWDSKPDYASGGISDHYMTGMAYVPNGKAVPVQYLVAFTATASGAPGPSYSADPEGHGFWNQSWSSIPPTQITMAGAPLGSDGILYKVVPSGSPPIDITPSFDAGPTATAVAAWVTGTGATSVQPTIVNGYHQFTVGADTSVPQILFNTTNVANSNTTVFVGQLINLTFTLGSGGPAMSNFSWTVPGNTFSNYVTTTSLGQVYTDFAINKAQVNFHWADGGSQKVWCSAMVNGQMISNYTTFTVKRPAATMIPTITGSIQVDNNYVWASGLFLHFSGYMTNGTNYVPGITFQINNGDTNGLYFFAQIANLRRLWTHNNTNNPPYVITNTGIDSGGPTNSWKYLFDSLLGTNVVSDSPGLRCYSTDNTACTGDFFSMYLMFSHISPNALPVPLQVVNWGWSATATNMNRFQNQWVLEPNSVSSNSPAMTTTSFPQWTNWANPDY